MLEQVHTDAFGWAIACCRGDRTEAADLLQSVYLLVLEGKARFEGRSSFKTWLFSVIRRAGFRRRFLPAVALKKLGQAWLRPGSQASSESDFARAELSEKVRKLLACLAGRQREVLHLVFYQEMTIEEAAAVMGVSVGSARTHYERGKKRLGARLRESGIGDEIRRERSGSQATV